MKVFYSASKKHEVIDPSGAHNVVTLQSALPEDKKSDDYQEVSLGVDEVQRIDADGKLTKADSKAGSESRKEARKTRKQSVKVKLGLTKADIRALKELLEDGDDD